jgi:hypothetical protein
LREGRRRRKVRKEERLKREVMKLQAGRERK